MSSYSCTQVFNREDLCKKIDEVTNKKLETYINHKKQKKLPIYIFVEAFSSDGSRYFFDGEHYMERCSICAERELALTTTTINGSASAKKISSVAFHYLPIGSSTSKLLIEQTFEIPQHPDYPEGPISNVILAYLRGCKKIQKTSLLREVDPKLIAKLSLPLEEKTKTKDGLLG